MPRGAARGGGAGRLLLAAVARLERALLRGGLVAQSGHDLEEEVAVVALARGALDGDDAGEHVALAAHVQRAAPVGEFEAHHVAKAEQGLVHGRAFLTDDPRRGLV